eukprot:TRINITY_DN69189_c0_g1_i1.p1 TRINITY_DN69189_c0_g1~~TRINITY_DN69189_c0_g1_i1.p1  ORF type:complete len:268 (-),score=56.16 TRINITY_DN69189_c0_g1_i1:50-853(-)
MDADVEAEARSAVLQNLLAELEGMSTEEVTRVRMYAGLRRVVHDRRRLAPHGGLLDLVGADIDAEEAPGSSSSTLNLTSGGGGGCGEELSNALLSLLDGRSLAYLGGTRRHWRKLPHWLEHWFLLGVQDFGKQKRLVPPGRFERFDANMLDSDVDWHRRYINFRWAARCPTVAGLRMAAVRVVHSLDLATSGLEEVRRRLASELQFVNEQDLSLECVEQLLEDASTMRSLGGTAPLDIDRSLSPLTPLANSPEPVMPISEEAVAHPD